MLTSRVSDFDPELPSAAKAVVLTLQTVLYSGMACNSKPALSSELMGTAIGSNHLA